QDINVRRAPMSHDIHLFNTPNLPALGEDPLHSMALGAPLAPPPSPIRKVQRLLRGRYLLAVVLALICGLIGAAWGWKSQKPKFSSDGIIWIKPVIPAITSKDRKSTRLNSSHRTISYA